MWKKIQRLLMNCEIFIPAFEHRTLKAAEIHEFYKISKIYIVRYNKICYNKFLFRILNISPIVFIRWEFASTIRNFVTSTFNTFSKFSINVTNIHSPMTDYTLPRLVVVSPVSSEHNSLWRTWEKSMIARVWTRVKARRDSWLINVGIPHYLATTRLKS